MEHVFQLLAASTHNQNKYGATFDACIYRTEKKRRIAAAITHTPETTSTSETEPLDRWYECKYRQLRESRAVNFAHYQPARSLLSSILKKPTIFFEDEEI